jgi:cbb3-type cytochrome oxidase subunit 1
VTPLVRRYIKTSFVFLLAGLLVGAYLVVGQFLLNVYPSHLHVTAHVHLLLVGFVLMIVMGVATWMFPRPSRDDTGYRPGLAEAVYWIMTIATAVRAVAEVLVPLAGLPGLLPLIAVAGLGQLAGTALFVANMWRRVRMPAASVPPAR